MPSARYSMRPILLQSLKLLSRQADERTHARPHAHTDGRRADFGTKLNLFFS